MIEKEKWGVHERHCCQIHGCKYGYEDCPVETKRTKGREFGGCESCESIWYDEYPVFAAGWMAADGENNYIITKEAFKNYLLNRRE